MAYVFTRQEPKRVLARFFFPQGASICEDPATGSAAANLGGWLIAHAIARPISVEISQGAQIGRASTLFLDLTAADQISVSGEVIELGRGSITL
jgi:PhzF family phenazine biosynthesis protein